MPLTILSILGTRPEAIKLAPVLSLLADDPDLHSVVVSTGQHRAIMDAVMLDLELAPDVDLNLQDGGQTLNQLAGRVMAGVDAAIVAHQPSAVLIQGDTTTVATAALAAFYRHVPVVHLEAGLRSGNLWSPFPEEANRRIVSQVASLHLAPTPRARANLLVEQVDDDAIHLTGNTVIDALHRTIRRPVNWTDPAVEAVVKSSDRLLLLTAHRRENWGSGLGQIAAGVAELIRTVPDLRVVLPLHANPAVETALRDALEAVPRVVLTGPLGYREFTHLMARSDVILTDSGGIQEEAPSLGKPVFVLRENTERPEAVDAGTVRLVGTDPVTVVPAVRAILDDPDEYARMARAANPFGDGRAAHRCVAAIRHLLGLLPRPEKSI